MNDDDVWKDSDAQLEEIKKKMATRPDWVYRLQFAAVYWSKSKIYVGKEEYVRGPRVLIWPLTEFDMEASSSELGNAVLEALDGYIIGNRQVFAEDKGAMTKDFLKFFGYRSLSEFYRKAIDLTVRRERTDSGDILSLGRGDTGDEVGRCPNDAEGLGQAILDEIHGDPRFRPPKCPKKKPA